MGYYKPIIALFVAKDHTDMKLERTERELFEALSDIDVIDAHEHLLPEVRRVARKVDFFILFSHYTSADLRSAGMGPDVYQRLVDDESMAVAEKWEAFAPFYPMIKYGSYARPARIWVRDVLGYDDLTEANCQEISERLQESNKPGLYERILRQMCHIRTALVPGRVPHEEYDMDLLKPLWQVSGYALDEPMQAFLRDTSDEGSRTLEGYLDWIAAEGERLRQVGVFGIKMVAFAYRSPNMEEARTAFAKLPAGGLTQEERLLIQSAVHDRVFDFARKHKLTVACHSGVWGDFRQSHPCHLIPIATAHPDVHFDLFHLGMPFVREAVLIGKMFPNVSLNLCWNAIVSPRQTVRMLDECIDMVPMNNIIAFGADYRIAVEKVYGHLIMAKEVVAKALGKRIRADEMDMQEALRIAKMWFCDNAVRIYGL